jgi:hypothetical protein
MHGTLISQAEKGMVGILFSARLIWCCLSEIEEIKFYFAQTYIFLQFLSFLFNNSATNETEEHR